jgi:putative DNA primase/helicase
MITLRTLRAALGGEISHGQVICPGPGHSPRDRSLTVRPNGDDFVVFSHAGDDWQTCKDYVRECLGWPIWQPGDGSDRRVSPQRLKDFDRAVVDAGSEHRERTEGDLDRIARARAIWDEAADPRGTLAESYLASRALVLDGDMAGNVLRFHAACPWRDEDTGTTAYLPALIAAFTSIDNGQVTAIQRVALTPEGKKIGRRMLGVVHRAAVKLDPAGTTLAIGEGVETAMAARQLGHKPAWALGSVGMIAQFPVMDAVERLRILAENGCEASAKAVELCGGRWHAAGRKVQVVTPDVGSDLNDELMAATA